jgi:hypothetical protein
LVICYGLLGEGEEEVIGQWSAVIGEDNEEAASDFASFVSRSSVFP